MRKNNYKRRRFPNKLSDEQFEGQLKEALKRGSERCRLQSIKRKEVENKWKY